MFANSKSCLFCLIHVVHFCSDLLPYSKDLCYILLLFRLDLCGSDRSLKLGTYSSWKSEISDFFLANLLLAIIFSIYFIYFCTEILFSLHFSQKLLTSWFIPLVLKYILFNFCFILWSCKSNFWHLCYRCLLFRFKFFSKQGIH